VANIRRYATSIALAVWTLVLCALPAPGQSARASVRAFARPEGGGPVRLTYTIAVIL